MKKLHRNLVDKHPWYAKWHQNPNHEIIHYGLLLVFTFFVLLGVISSWKTQPSNLAGQAYQPFSDLNFCERLQGKREANGSDAVRALGRDIDRVANHYGLDGEKLKKGFETDKTLKINCDGLLFYAENPFPVESSLGDGTLPTNPTVDQIPDSETFILHSKPAVSQKIYINPQGVTIENTSWNYNGPITLAKFSWDSDSAFSSAELNAIKSIWRNVSEDYAPFNVDVTTEPPISYDPSHYAQLIVTPSHQWYGNSGGVAFIGSFLWGNGTPAFVFTQFTNNLGVEQNIYNVKNLSEASSHETGHTLGLYHIAPYSTSCIKQGEYSWGTGSNPGFGPIMGAGYSVGVTHFINTAEYPLLAGPYGCNAEQNDIAIILGNVSYAPDEAGATPNTAGNLNPSVSGDTATVDKLAILTSGDTDIYRINTIPGDIQFTVNPMTPIGTILGDTDFKVRLLDSNLNVVSESNPPAIGSATVQKIAAPSGTYYLEISPSGYLDPSQPGGYTATGSMGQYQITGSYSGDFISPTASISNPIMGATISGTTTVSATGTDNRGVVKMELYIDNVLTTQTTLNTLSYSWNTKRLKRGSHSVLVKAYDQAGNIGQSNITVNK